MNIVVLVVILIHVFVCLDYIKAFVHQVLTNGFDITQIFPLDTPAPQQLLPPKMFLFGFGKLIYIIVLLTNAIAVLSEDRFLARIGWSNTAQQHGFGQQVGGDTSIKHKLINLMTSIRTLMRIPLILINTVIIIYELFLG